MNLLDIRTGTWSQAALDATAPGLAARLGRPVPAHVDIGGLHACFVERYGFSPACRVIAFSGDNPNSLAGLRLQTPGRVAVSLGTSDTMFGSAETPRPSGREGHVFIHPVDPKAFMVMLVHQNGSLAREAVRDRFAGGTWEAFSEALRATPPGNAGRIGIYWPEPEISPPTARTGIFRRDAAGRAVEAFPPAAEIRAIVESQFVSFRLHGEALGLLPRWLVATGGGAANRELVQVMADVFGVPVWGGERTASASFGAACRALHGWLCVRAGRFVPFAEATAGAPPFRKLAEPDPSASALYTETLSRWQALERELLETA